MALIKWTPFLEPLSVFDEFDRFFEGFVPAIDVYQTKDDVVAETALPGIDPLKVNISIENDVLTIEGESDKKSEVEDKNYYRKEVRYGQFHRSVALPASVDTDKADAIYENGILKIKIPKREEVKAKKVEVRMKK